MTCSHAGVFQRVRSQKIAVRQAVLQFEDNSFQLMIYYEVSTGKTKQF